MAASARRTANAQLGLPQPDVEQTTAGVAIRFGVCPGSTKGA